MRLFLFVTSVIIASQAGAKEIYQWYDGLNDPPGANINLYSETKLLPVDFLLKIGLRDSENFIINAPKIKKNGKESVWKTVVDEANEKLTLPSVVRTYFFKPSVGKEESIYGKDFQKEEYFDYLSPSYKNPNNLANENKLEKVGFVARITMSHKKPDKILRFYEKLDEISPPIKPFLGKNVCSNKDQSDPANWQKKVPYGLWRLAQARLQNRIFLVEGESTAQALWFNGYPAIAFGGATKWHDNYIKYLDGIRNIYVMMEADSGGKALLSCMRKISVQPEKAYQEFAKRAQLVVLGAYGDASDLHVAIYENKAGLKDQKKKDKFKRILDSYISQGVLLNHPGFSSVTDKITHESKASELTNYDPSLRGNSLQTRLYSEDVGDGILTGKPKVNSRGEVVDPKDLYKTHEIIPNTTLQDYSRKKYISVAELLRAGFRDGIYPHRSLGPVFGIKMTTYNLPQGKTTPEEKRVEYYRYRISMDSNQSSSNRFPPQLFTFDGKLRNSQKKIIYGLEWLPVYQAAESVYFVEGESDTLSMRHYGFPTIGIPGTHDWNPAWESFLKKVPKLIVNIEPDEGGETLMSTLINTRLAEQLLLIDFSSGGKDPSDLHVDLTKEAIDEINKTLLAENKKPISIEDFFESDKFHEKRLEISKKYAEEVQKLLANGIYWKDVKYFFKKFMEKNKAFYDEQKLIRQKAESKKCKDLNNPTPGCLKHQEVDMRYMGWPHVDFYRIISGLKMKTYYDENDKERPFPVQ